MQPVRGAFEGSVGSAHVVWTLAPVQPAVLVASVVPVIALLEQR